jgi:biotin synthase-related radical SAM superfamily protein
LKVRLLAEGLRVELRDLAASTRPTLRTRSGSCGGLDLILPDGTWVNAPVRERFARRSSIRLTEADQSAWLASDDLAVPVRLASAPAYYALRTHAGRPMKRIGQLCSDRVGIGITNTCTYWLSEADRCKFCSIGLNVRDERSRKAPQDVLETVLAAASDAQAPARHVLLGGGTPDREGAGIPEIAELATVIREHCEISIYAMVAPPKDLAYLNLLAESGVDEVGINIEVFSEEAARYFIPAKHAAAGVDGYWRALERCVELFGPINTRSITVVGLEDREVTLRGVERLAAMGVLPILSPLRPLDGTLLEGYPTPSAAELWDLTEAAAETAGDN